jgi:hypothetical protein
VKRYALVIDKAIAEIAATLPEDAHDLLMLACLDLPSNPYGLGRVLRHTGAVTTLTHDLGSMLIVYDVDEEPEPALITVTTVITL